ncbi:Jerky protein-like-like [Holothuria leucospilota]|uniref:Jerky protein-like-like n=1 Tax=Holothuria leucospilota TaxID=206669 RepID=A0A9Q1CP32_HOLLE|nr:Jerky protein-like-like [Holothuria leucospilota]
MKSKVHTGTMCKSHCIQWLHITSVTETGNSSPVRESVDVLSDDLQHDSHAVNHFVEFGHLPFLWLKGSIFGPLGVRYRCLGLSSSLQCKRLGNAFYFYEASDRRVLQTGDSAQKNPTVTSSKRLTKHTMTRTYIRRSDRGFYGIGRLQDAVKEMREKGLKLRLTARMYGIPKSTLERHVKKEAETMNATTLKLGPTSCFSPVQEEELKKHILELESRGFGLTPMEIRTLAYDYAEANNIEHKFNKQKRVAGYSWLEAFMRRNPSLSLRKPEPLSLARSMGMNKVRVQNFQSQLQDIFVRENFFDCPKAIYNVDETGISQVHKPPKIIAAKGKKNIYSTTSGEKGTTVTAVVCGNAAGYYIPPFLIFKGKRSNPLLATGAPSGTVVELSENGWIDKAIFLRWLQFFNKEARRNAEGKCLLILDGHASHLTIEVLKYANKNKIMLLCLPPPQHTLDAASRQNCI